MIKKTISLIILVLFAASFFATPGAIAQQKRISDIKIEGNYAVSTTTIINRLKIRVGDVFDEMAINKELKRLYATGYFNDVSVDIQERPEGVSITFTVIEKPVIDKIEFRGNKKIKSGRLNKQIKVKKGVLLDQNLLAQDVNTIETYYIEQGYNRVSVDYKIESEPRTGKAVVVFVIDEGQPRKITAIEIEGNISMPDDEIKKYMATKTAFFFLRKGALDEHTFDSDLDRIRTLYRSKGFLDATVTGEVDYSADGKQIFLTVKVDEGKKYLIGEVKISGELVFQEDKIRDLMKIQPGDPFDYGMIREDIESVRAFYYAKGYMNADIGMKHRYNSSTDRMDIHYNINGGEVVYVGKINIVGNTKTRDKIIRRELRVYPGERYDGNLLKKSKERIYNLGYFEDVYFDTVPTSREDIKDLNVSVKETKTGELSFGGGYSSVDAFIGFAQIRQRNFDILNFPTFTGGGQDLTIRAELGSQRNNYFLSWTDPWIFGYPYLFGFDVYRQEYEKSSNSGYGYNETRTGASLRFGKDITDELNTGFKYNLEEVKIDNVPDDATDALRREEGKNVVSSLSWSVTYDTRDNRYSPKTGIVAGNNLKWAGGWLQGDKDFVKDYAYASYYHPVISEKVILELRLRGGVAQNYGQSDEVPIYERFFAGGGSTIRGYRQRGVGPRDRGTNTALGGEAMLIGNAEVTFPIWEKLIKGAVFYDVGNVWPEATFDGVLGAKDDNGFKAGVGVGVRVKTPIGPVKLDYGYPLNNNYDDKRNGEFYFSVTHGF